MKYSHVYLVLLILVFLTSSFQFSHAEYQGETLYVGVLKLPVHERPDGFSRVVREIPFGTKATAIEYLEYYRLPDSVQPPSWILKRKTELKRLREKGETAITARKIKKLEKELAEGKRVPKWVRIEAGYVPYTAMVPAIHWSVQNEKAAQARVKNWAVVRGKKGFSEEERDSADAVAMKGLGGKAMLAAPNYGAFDAIMDKDDVYDFHDAYKAFRQQGRLGEYQ